MIPLFSLATKLDQDRTNRIVLRAIPVQCLRGGI